MKLKTKREFDSEIRFTTYDIKILSTLNSAEEELWSLLEKLTNRYQANQFLTSKLGKKKYVKRISPILTEYILQAKSFFDQAENSNSNVSPLLYYYGMLNLVKAFIVTRDPFLIVPKLRGKFHSGNLSHGVSAGENVKQSYSIYKEKIDLRENGIFAHFYELQMGSKISSLQPHEKKISITNILGYCTDISSEYSEIFFSRKNIIQVDEVRIARKEKQAWSNIYIAKKTLDEKGITVKTLLTRNSAFAQFHRVQSVNKETIILEENTPFAYSSIKNLNTQSRKKMNPMRLISSLSNNPYSLDYSIPLFDVKSKDVLLHEELNIYLLMFYFGSLVRYQPYAFNELISTQEGWVVQSFIKTCPKKFLRLMVGNIYGSLYVFDEI